MVIIGGVVKSDLIFRESPRCLTPPVALRPIRVSCHNNMFSSRVVTRGLASTVSPKLMSLIHNNNNNNNYNRNNYACPSMFDCSLHHHHHEESEQLSVNLKLPVINSSSCWKKKLLNICVTLLLGVVLGFVNMPRRMCYAVPLGSGESSSSITYHSCNSNCPNTKLLQEKVDSFTKLVEEQEMQRYRYYDCDHDCDHDRSTGDAMAVVFILYFIIKYYKYTLLYPSIVIIPMLIVLRLWRLWDDIKLSKARRVLVFQVGFLDKEKKLQTELNRIIAQTADTSNSEGFNFLFKEVVKVLFQHYDACRFGYTSFVRCVSDTEKNYGDDLAKTIKNVRNQIGSDDKCGEQLLKQIHTRELMRHGRDRGTTEIELNNWQFEKLAVGNKEHSMLDNDDYTVVTLLVLARGWIKFSTDFLCNTKRLECTTKRIKAILQIFDGIQTNQIESVKVWCAPHSADEVEEKLDRDDPLLNFMQEHLLSPVEPLTELNAEFTHHMEDSENAEKDISDISFSADDEEVPRRPRKSRSRATRFMEVAEAVLRRAGIPPPQNPYFVAQRGLKRNTLPMPTELVRELELPEVITICDERGRECRGPVNKWSDGRVWLSKGWKVFCRQNEVEDNDWCIIEIVKPPRGDIFLQARLVRA